MSKNMSLDAMRCNQAIFGRKHGYHRDKAVTFVNEEIGQFRTAALGGFHRQDVLDYIAKSAESSNAKISALQEQVEQLTQERNDAKAESDALRAELETASQERDDAASKAECACVELERQEKELTELREETARLTAQVARLQPEVEAMERLKHQIADIELDARTRGEAIVGHAGTQAKETREKTTELLKKTKCRFDIARTDVEATTSHVMGELERLMGELNQLMVAFDGDERALSALLTEED